MDRQELGCWLRLLGAPGIGREAARRLLSHFGSVEAAFDAPTARWSDVLSQAQCNGLSETQPAALLDRTWAWLQSDSHATAHSILVLGDVDYPQVLLESPDPPLLLYLIGRRELLGRAAISMVGSRGPTPQGREHAHAFAKALSEAGMCVVSGLALGIDGAAHEGALEGPGGTIAVLGTGVDTIHPKRHASLAQRIARDGLLLSEYALGTPALPQHFPARNRVIAGLSAGTLVVEAAMQSGSLITARLASEAGREVFAVPGPIHAPLSRGCHWLIQQGAKLVTQAQDVLDELRPDQLGPPPPTPLATSPHALPNEAPRSHQALLNALGYEPVSLEALMSRTGEDASRLTVQLLELELTGLIHRLPGQLFQRRALG